MSATTVERDGVEYSYYGEDDRGCEVYVAKGFETPGIWSVLVLDDPLHPTPAFVQVVDGRVHPYPGVKARQGSLTATGLVYAAF